jgi:hypothetical protein
MPIDTSKIAIGAQEFMASLEGDEEFNNAEIVEVGIVVHIRTPEEDGESMKDGAPTYCSNDSRIYQTGLFHWALDSAEWSGEPGEIPDVEE